MPVCLLYSLAKTDWDANVMVSTGHKQSCEVGNTFTLDDQKHLNVSILAITAAVGCVFIVCVYLLAGSGQPWADELEEVNPEAALRNAMIAEYGERPDEAIFFYRKALSLGLDWPPTREECLARFTTLLQERGKNRDCRVLPVNQLLRDGSFEADSASVWREGLPPLDAMATDNLERIAGQRSLVVPLDGDSPVCLRQEISLVEGARYRLTCWMRTHNVPSPGLAMGVEAAGDDTSSVIAATGHVEGTSEWSQMATDFVVPPGFRRFAVIAFAGEQNKPAPDADGQRVWLDGCGIERADEELLRNGSLEFENGVLAHWQQSGGMSPFPDETCLVEGRNALRFEVTASDNLGSWQTVMVEPGKEYELAGWIRTDRLAGPGARLEVHDSDGWQKWFKAGDQISGTSDWREVKLRFVVPEDTGFLSVLLRKPQGAAGSSQTSGTVWFDAYSLRKMGG